MPAAPDPFQPHLNRASSLFEQGEVVQAGQIWQAILKRNPAHRAARAGLYLVKLALEHRDASRTPQDDERLLQEGCTLFDMGQVEDALRKWEQILAANPRHQLAFAYANDARRELGRPPLPEGGPAPGGPAPGPGSAPAWPEPAWPEPAAWPDPAVPPGPAGGDVAGAAQQVLEGVQLYDMGMTEEAMAKWERALELDPDQRDAPAYLGMARRDQAQAAQPKPAQPARPASAPQSPQAPPAPLESAPLEAQIIQAEELLRLQRLLDAVQAFQRLLDREPQDPRILRGYHQARALLTAKMEPAIALDRPEPKAPTPLPPADPPSALTARSAPVRSGFRLPGAVRRLARPRWLSSTRQLALALGLLLLVVAALIGYGLMRREAALREAVAAAKQNALKPVSRRVEIPSLAESSVAIHQEAERVLGDDPLRAYFRAREWQRREPDNPAASGLVDRARTQLARTAPAGTPEDCDRMLQSGDLDGARRSILRLLPAAPDDPGLQARAREVVLALVPLYVTRDRMDEARNALLLARAMFPQEKIWPAKLQLLESIQGMAKDDRAAWIQLLG
jgi:tetratricopeptide (TPR) repeat protein